MALTRPKYSQIYDTDYKQSVRVATTEDVGNLFTGNTQPNVVDGVTLRVADRILVKDQANTTQNGIYSVRSVGTGSNGWWTRSLDADQNGFITSGMTTIVSEGNLNPTKTFRLTTVDPIYIGNTALTFVNPFASTVSAGGTDTQVQFNDLSTLNGTAGFTFNKSSNVLTVGNSISTTTLIASGNVSGQYILGDGSNLTGIDATSIQSGNTSVKTYSASNVAISVGGSANTVVFTTSNVIVSGSILPSANIAYDLGSPTNRFRTGYFSANTIDLGGSQISVTDAGFSFNVNGNTAVISASNSATANIYLDKSNGYMGFNDPTPDYYYDFLSAGGGELLHIESLNATQVWLGATNASGLHFLAGTELDRVFSGSQDRPDHYHLVTNGIARANIHGSTGNVIFSNSVSVTQDLSTTYLGTQEFRATGANITVRSDVTLLGTKLFGAGQLAIGTEDIGAERLFVTGGETYLDGDVTISGNLFVNGNVTRFNANDLIINDSIIFLADNNPADTLDIGIVSSFTDAVRYQHTGFVRDATDGVWKLFANVVPEPTTTVNFNDANYGNILVGNIQATYFTGNGAFLTGLPAGYSNVNAATFFASGTATEFINTTGNLSVGGNVSTKNLFVNVINGTNAAPNTAVTIRGYTGGTSSSLIANHQKTLVIGGDYNQSYNSGNAAILHILDYSNDANDNVYPIYCEDENNGVDFYIYSGNTNNISSKFSYFGGAIKINAANANTAIVNSGTNGTGNIGASGAGFNTVFAKSTSAQYADLAEVYTSDQQYPAGTVVVFGGSAEVMQSHSSHDTRIAGVVSTNPAYLMNSTETGVPVALQGRVPCRVLGPVSQGDRVVSSHIAGVAQALDPLLYQPGCIIGKALQAIDSQDIQTIEVVVGRV